METDNQDNPPSLEIKLSLSVNLIRDLKAEVVITVAPRKNKSLYFTVLFYIIHNYYQE